MPAPSTTCTKYGTVSADDVTETFAPQVPVAVESRSMVCHPRSSRYIATTRAMPDVSAASTERCSTFVTPFTVAVVDEIVGSV